MYCIKGFTKLRVKQHIIKEIDSPNGESVAFFSLLAAELRYLFFIAPNTLSLDTPPSGYMVNFMCVASLG